MFGLGMPEILMILAIALIVIGPKKLPDLAKTLGRAMGEFKRSAQDFKHSINMETTVKDVTDLENFTKESDSKEDQNLSDDKDLKQQDNIQSNNNQSNNIQSSDNQPSDNQPSDKSDKI